MSSVQYCVKISPEEFESEMKKYTSDELSNLINTQEKNNDSSSDYYENSNDESDDSDDSNEELQSNDLALYKKTQEIDNLESKNYYKTLEMSNLLVENTKLKKEIEILTTKNFYLCELETFIQRIITVKSKLHFDNNININSSDISDIVKYTMELQKFHDTMKYKINYLEQINNTFQPVIKDYYNKELQIMDKTVVDIYLLNKNKFNEHIKKISKNNNHLQYINMLFLILLFLFFFVNYLF
jgi:hypothetical protein